MSAEAADASLSKVTLSFVLGLAVGVGFAFPEVSRQLLLLAGTLGDLGPAGFVVVVGSLAVVPLTIGLFVLWRTVQAAG